jgi:maltooligosyltrehalose trehalohydrolase
MKEAANAQGNSQPPTHRADPLRRKWGAQVTGNGVEYATWAPDHADLAVEIHPIGGSPSRSIQLIRDTDGFHHATDPHGLPGDRYRFRIGDRLLPDPASRAQAGSVHEDSQVVDPRAYAWRDHPWSRPSFRDLVIYELHIGTFTPEGTFRAAIEKLPHLAALGINAIEIMPVADFPGNRSWGYDGVLLYAPARAYGSPDDLRALVDAAHQQRIAVILDVVFNHFGPDGNYLAQFSRHFFTERHHTPWGAAFNFDGTHSAPVRDFFVSNVIDWMGDFHIDGFRLDATHEIADDSPRHILAEITDAIHARGGYAIAEDARNDQRLVLPTTEGGLGFDAVWADDFHHIARVSQTRESEGYFRHYRGALDELIDTLQHGWHYRGQPSPAGRVRGTPCRHLEPSRFLHCIANHDQVGNQAFGERLNDRITPEAYRALSVLLCLTPYTPMLFMGQEWAASTPFLFFTDHHAELGAKITEGRRKEFSAFAAFRDPGSWEKIPDPQAMDTFIASKLNWPEARNATGVSVMALYQKCLALRRQIPAFRPPSRDTWRVERAGTGVATIEFSSASERYLLIFDLTGGNEADLTGNQGSSKIGAPWKAVLSSNDPSFGGAGSSAFDFETQRCRFQRAEAILLHVRSTPARMET